MTIVKCPVCEGRGVVPRGFYNPCPDQIHTTIKPETCRRCNGRGTINYSEQTPWIPYKGGWFYPTTTDGK